MKIRYYRIIDGWRWLGFILAMCSAAVLTGGEPEDQMWGWAIAAVSCSIWVYMGFKDRDIPRALMEVMYIILAIRGIYNWWIL